MSARTLSLVTCLAVLATLFALVPLATPALANHGTRTLEAGHCETDGAQGESCEVATGPGDTVTSDAAVVANEVDDNPVGAVHTMRAVLSAPADQASGVINIDWEIESGPGDRSGAQTGGTDAGSAGNTPFQPDFTCDVVVGENSCEVQYTSTQIGTDTIRVWIDHDKNNATLDPETYDSSEGRYANNTTDCGASVPQLNEGDCRSTGNPPPVPAEGSKPEPDGTDVIQKNWVAGPASVLDCEPETATNPSTGTGSSETYTCTVTDERGNAISGIPIDGENLNGANDPDNDASGTATQGNPDANRNDTCQNSPGGGTAESGAVRDCADYNHEVVTENDDTHFCTTGSNGSCSGTVAAQDAEAGPANICFWADNENSDTDAALEGDGAFIPTGDQNDGGDCDSETQPTVDSDLTDVVTKTWQQRSTSGGGVDAEPETDTNNLGENHTITATVFDQFGDRFTGSTTVKFEFFTGSPTDADGNTPETPDRTCTTSNSNSCSITYTSNKTGTDLVCVFTNANPVMSGNNTNGTCDGEALNDADDAAGGDPDAPEPANDDQDVVQKIWQDPGTASRLNCEPETDTNPVGTPHTITCTATNAGGTAISGANVDAEATGANDPDNSDSPTTPDFTCNTRAEDPTTPTVTELGTCTFTHTGASQGVTTYRAWIDTDKDNATTEADQSEGRDEAAAPGAQPEPDGTDVVEKSWVAAPASLTISPKSDTAPAGTCNAYTITVLNSSNTPAQGATIDVEQRHERSANSTANDEPRVSFCVPSEGPNPSGVDESRGDLRPPAEDPDNVGTAGGETTNRTDANGKITIGIFVTPANGSDGSGKVDIVAFFETTDNDDPDSGEPQDTATKTWTRAEPRTIACTPRTATNQVGTTHTVTCTVKDQFGTAVQGEGVTFTETGPGNFTTPQEQTTNAQGQASATTTSDEAGTQSITATLNDDQGAGEPNEVDECDRAANDPSGTSTGNCSDTVTKTWISDEEPPPPPAAECDDDVDNDGDGFIDFGDDPSCDSATDDTEAPQDEVVTQHARTLSIDAARHVRLPGKSKPALLIKGQVLASDGFNECASEVPVKIQIRAGGEWVTRKSDTTNDNGVFKVLVRDVAARYRAVAPKFQIADTSNPNQIDECLKAKDTIRHGHGG